MTRDELFAELRHVIDDTVRPYGWTDGRLALWLSEGQDKFCEQTGFWADATTYTLTTVLDQQNYPIDPRIIAVRSVWVGNRQLIDGVGKTFSDTDFADTAPQEPVHYRTDRDTGFITFIEPVTAGVTVTLRVHRRSKVRFSVEGTELEIPEEFHLAPVEYAAAKAFGDHDRELQDPVKARDHMLNFKAYTKDGSRAYRRLTGEYSDVAPSPLYVV